MSDSNTTDSDLFSGPDTKYVGGNSQRATGASTDTVVGYLFDKATGKWTRHEVPVRDVLGLETGYSSDVSCPHVFGWFDRTDDPAGVVIRDLVCDHSVVERLLGVVPLRNLTTVIRGRGARASNGAVIDAWVIVEGGSTAIAVAQPPVGSPVGTPLKILERVDQFGWEGLRGVDARVDANVYRVEDDRRALEELERAKATAKVVSLDAARLARQAVSAVDAVTKGPEGGTATDGDGF